MPDYYKIFKDGDKFTRGGIVSDPANMETSKDIFLELPQSKYYGVKGTSSRDYDPYSQVTSDFEKAGFDWSSPDASAKLNEAAQKLVQSKLGRWGYNVIDANEYAGWQEAYKQGVGNYGRPTSPQAMAELEQGRKIVAEYLAGLNKPQDLTSTDPTISREEHAANIEKNKQAASDRFFENATPEDLAKYNAGQNEDTQPGVETAVWTNEAGQTIDPTKYTTMRGQAMEDWAKSQGFSKSVSKASSPTSADGQVTKLSSGQSVVRDIAKEKAALAEYGKIYGKMPSTDEEWTKLHDLAYAGDKTAQIPKGYDKIDHPDNIGQYDDIQRVGKIGEPGSYLIGQKKVDIPSGVGGNGVGAAGGGAGAPTGGVPGAGGVPVAAGGAPVIPGASGGGTPAGGDPYRTFLEGQESATDIYSQLAEKLGISDYQKDIEGISGTIRETEELLDNLEKDISSRSAGKGVSDALRRRYLASEGKPLREQLADLYESRGVAQEGSAGARQTLSDMYAAALSDRTQAGELAKYKSPQEELAAKITEEKALQKAGIKTAPSTTQDSSMLSKGYKYVKTPAERDSLKAKGHDIVEIGGRTYSKAPKAPTGGSGGGTSSSKDSENAMAGQLNMVRGEDTFVSPDDWKKARDAWGDAGLNVTTFDTKFRGYRNPNNPNYVTTKQKVTTDTGRNLTPGG